jgi:hypothetical protein
MEHLVESMMALAAFCICPAAWGQCGYNLQCESHLYYDSDSVYGYSITYDTYYEGGASWAGVGIYTDLETPTDSYQDEIRYNLGYSSVVFGQGIGTGEVGTTGT